MMKDGNVEGLIFQFVIEYSNEERSSSRRQCFENAFGEEALEANGLKCAISKNLKRSYGFVYRPGGDVEESDRRDLERWIRSQEISCEVSFGDVEPCGTADFNSPFESLTFVVDHPVG